MRKKFTMLLAALFLVMGTAWAQTAVTFEIGKSYALKCKATDHVGNLADDGTKFNGRAASPTRIVFESAADGKYYIKSKETGKYLNVTDNAISYDDAASTAWIVGSLAEAPGYVYFSTDGATRYLNNNGGEGVGYLQLATHPSGIGTINACSLWKVSDFYPFELSTAEEKNYYTIKSGRDTDGKTWWYTYTGEKIKLTQYAGTENQLWYFMETTDGYLQLYPKTGEGKVMSYENSSNGGDKITAKDLNAQGWTNTWTFVSTNGAAPYGLKTSDGNNYLSNYDGVSTNMGMWNAAPNSDSGTAMHIMTEAAAVAEVASAQKLSDAKNGAKAKLDNFAALPMFISADEYKTRVDAVSYSTEGTSAEIIASYNAAFGSIDPIVDEYEAAAYTALNGKNMKLTNNGNNGRAGNQLGYDNTNKRAAAVASSGDDVIWTIKSQANGSFKLYNFVNNVYLGTPADPTPVIAAEADAPAFKFIATEGQKAALVTNGKMVHVANHSNFKLIQHYSLSDGASLWTIAQAEDIVVTRGQYDAAAAAKEALPYAIQQAYGLVTDATNYYSNWKSTQEGSYEALLDNDLSDKSYFHSAYTDEAKAPEAPAHYIQADMGDGKSIDEFYFYMVPRAGNGNNRPKNITVYGSNDINGEFTKIADVTTTLDGSMTPYMSDKLGTAETNYRYIRLTVTSTNTDSKFFTLSELYFFPAAYGVEDLVDSYKNFTALSITSDEMAEVADKLASAEATLALSNIKKEALAILTANADKVDDSAEGPALGKYPTATYEALRNAYNNGTTEAEIRTAIDNFTKSLNKPVYIITSAWDAGYPGGSSIYYDGAWKWKKTNKFDHQMWMTIPGYTEANVPVVDTYDAEGTSYAICDYLTGTKMRGKDVQIVKVPNWEGAYSLQYNADGENLDAAQHAKDNGALVNWKAALVNDRQASAWRVEYVGNTYELDQLTDEYLSALGNLDAAVTANFGLFYAEEGNGLGQYQGDLDPMKDALLYGGQTVSLGFAALLNEIKESEITLEQIQNYTKTLTETELNINQPTEGYYRIKGANNNVNPYAYYLTGKTNGDGGRIALQAEADASTVFHYKDGKLRAVQSGLYVGLNSANYTFQLYANNAPTMTFGASTYAAGAYTIRSDRYLHYKVYNGEVELDRCDQNDANDAWYLEAVAEVPASNALTAINDIDANATYRIYGERGFIYVADDGNMKCAGEFNTYRNNIPYSSINDKHHFAIVTIGENKYLYNVGAKKFVTKSGNGVALTDYPEHAIVITPATEQNTDYDWKISLNGRLLNLSDGGGHTYGVLTNWDTEDPGNRWAIYKVGTFNPDEAESMRKVVINYTVDGQTFTKTHGVALGTVFNFSYDFAAVTSCKVNDAAQTITEGACSVTIQDNATIAVEIDQDLPFEAVIDDSKILSSTWYYLQMHSNTRKYIQYLPEQTYIEWEDATFEDGEIASHSWAFVGNVVEGFKMINFAATTTKALKATNNNPSMANLADGTAFILAPTGEVGVVGGFCMKRPDDVTNKYLNAQSGKVAYWNDDDAGSTFIVTPSSVVPTRGKFYRIKNNSETGYLSSGTSGRTQFVADIATDASSIFYYDGDGKLLSYKNGMYLNVSNNKLEYSEAIGTGVAVEFQPSRTIGKLQILFNGNRYLFSETAGPTDSGDTNAKYIDPTGGNPAGRNANYLFTVEEVTTLPVTVTAAQVTFNEEQKYVSTLFAPVALEVPAGITAYIGVNEDNYLAMEPIESEGEDAAIIPANTGVILMADEAKKYEFSISAAAGAAIEDGANIITGTVAKTVITPDANTTCYVLANDDQDGVGLYKALKNKNESGAAGNTSFFNNACKAYIPVSVAEPQAAQALVFRFRGKGQGTTEIEMPMANGQQPAAIYDLTGRRITEIVEKGIYIVNGKKVVIK